MMPPECPVCGRDLRSDPDLKFGQVRFANFEPIDGPGHPEGLVWFCVDHLDAAKELEHLSSSDAIRELREKR